MNLWSRFEDEIMNSELDVATKNEILSNIENIKNEVLNIMFVGGTGVGKSSTINAIFDVDVAKVGYNPSPETKNIKKYQFDNLILWDTPGLGDSPSNDSMYAKQIAKKLIELDEKGSPLIDLVVVIIDGANRDLRTSYEIIENLIFPYCPNDRILIAINQCDVAMKGRGWDVEKNMPTESLIYFLDEQARIIKDRIRESLKISVEPIYYSALHKYNISKLLNYILKNAPEKKRILFIESLNKDPEIWRYNDDLQNYNEEIRNEFEVSLLKVVGNTISGFKAGAKFGASIPIIGPIIGGFVGGILGFFSTFI